MTTHSLWETLSPVPEETLHRELRRRASSTAAATSHPSVRLGQPFKRRSRRQPLHLGVKPKHSDGPELSTPLYERGGHGRRAV